MDLIQLEKWKEDNGDQTHRIQYDLNELSTIIDVGGYKGEWTKLMSSIYKCNIYTFEPVKKFYDEMIINLYMHEKIHTFNFGFSPKTEYKTIYLDDDSTSLFAPSRYINIIQLIEFKEFFISKNFHTIDLMKINIEGEEFDLMDHIIENNLHLKIKNFQIQFHDWMPHAEYRRQQILDKLLLTHYPTYQYKFVWENYKLKE